jgi:hypothetical protein
MKLYAAILSGLVLLAPAAAFAAKDPAGLWEGSLKTPNAEVGFVFNIHHDGDKWAAEMDVPMQGASDVPLKDVKVDGASVSFAIPAPGEPRFDGKLSDDGKTITGNFGQGGAMLPLELKWKSEPRAAARIEPNSGDIQVLEGVWEGALETGGPTLHLRLNFVKNADGSITGTLDSIDQNANGIPINTISRKGDTIKLVVKIVGGGFEGDLDKMAATMKGTWSQGGGDMPLTLQRAKADKK